MKIAEKKLRQIIKESVREVVKGQLDEIPDGRHYDPTEKRDMSIKVVLDVYAHDLNKANTYLEFNKAGDTKGAHSKFQYAMRICDAQQRLTAYPKTCAAVQVVKQAIKAALARIKANEKKVRTP